MSERFKPEISEARRHKSTDKGWWLEDKEYEAHDFLPATERALLVRGVPMIGERVVWRNAPHDTATVIRYELYPVLRWDDDEGEDEVPLDHCYPAPDEDESLVERVAAAIAEEDESGAVSADDPWAGVYRAMARAASRLRAMREADDE